MSASNVPTAYIPPTLEPLWQTHREYPDQLNRLVGKLLSKLVRLHPADVLGELSQYELAGRLLNEPALAQALRELRGDPHQQNLIDKLLRTANQRLWYKATGMATNRPAVSPTLESWLKMVDLVFNPFGPERTENDPLLPDFAIDFAVEQMRGARAVLMWGKPGAGLTGTAFLLMHNCYNPFTNPREPETFPVYCTFPAGIIANRRECLAWLAQATSRALADYLANVPEGFLDLPLSRQEQLGRLLLTCAGGSRRQLHRQLRDYSRVDANRSLVTYIENLDLEIHAPGGLDEAGWIDLLRDSLPSGFSRLYCLIDTSITAGDTHSSATWLKTLLSLAGTLQTIGIYLKLFLASDAQPKLSAPADIDCIALRWSTDNLRQMLRQRMRAASKVGQDSLNALRDTGAQSMEIDEVLVSAAKTPQQLVHWGNRLFEIFLENRQSASQLTQIDIARWQAELLAHIPQEDA